jgi:hypothetical protein
MKKIIIIVLVVLCSVVVVFGQSKNYIGYQLEYHNCPKDANFLVIHLDRLASERYESSSYPYNRNSLSEFLARKNTKRSIEGLVSVQVELYKVTVEKGNLFSWKVLIPKIKDGIRQWFKTNTPLAVVKSPIYKGCEYNSGTFNFYNGIYTATETY